MYNKKIISLFATVGMMMSTLWAQDTLTLEQCRRKAIESNKALKMAAEKKTETKEMEKMAMWQMLPKVSANGAYIWMDKSINLLSEEQKNNISHIGNVVGDDLTAELQNSLSDIPLVGEAIATRLGTAISNSNAVARLNEIGQGVVEELETDSRNVFVGAVTLTQPIYMGGKLHALYRSASLLNHLSDIQYNKQEEEVLLSVDEAYWLVVSVQYKKELAEKYATLLRTLTNNVEEMVKAEVATQGDLMKVKVKLNEAEMSLTKATNSLTLAKMLLAQRCGMPLENAEEMVLATTIPADASSMLQMQNDDREIYMENVYESRNEMKMLRISDSIAQQGVRIAASTLKPNIIATGGYMISNPNLFDGFHKQFDGSFMAGVGVNIPIFHPGGIHSIKMAKAKRKEVAYQIQEAEEMIELQVNKLNYELELSYKKLVQAISNLNNAEENLRLADESFAAGMCSSSDLMAAQTAWLQARSEVIDAQIDIKMNTLYLQQAIGEKVE